MGKRVFLSAVVAGMLVGVGVCLAGVEPSPFEPEINKLHSIEQNITAINKGLAKLNELDTLPEGATEYLNAMANQMQGLKARLEEVLLVVPLPSFDAPFIGQDEVVFVLDGIRGDSSEGYGIIENIVSRMGVGPSPFSLLFNDVSRRIIIGINDHLRTVVIPPLTPPPRLSHVSLDRFERGFDALGFCTEQGLEINHCGQGGGCRKWLSSTSGD